MSNVEVHQLTSKCIDSFLNVDEGLYHVRVWTSSFSHPTYLLELGDHVGLIQFDDQAIADEWLEDYPGYKATLLTNEEK